MFQLSAVDSETRRAFLRLPVFTFFFVCPEWKRFIIRSHFGDTSFKDHFRIQMYSLIVEGKQ